MTPDLVSAERAAELLKNATPGEWRAAKDVRAWRVFVESPLGGAGAIGGASVRWDVANGSPKHGERAEGNAALLAAAPSLARTVIALEARAVAAEGALAEAEATIANERGEGEPPSEGWEFSRGAQRWERIYPDGVRGIAYARLGKQSALWERFIRGDRDLGGSDAPSARAAMIAADLAAKDGGR